MRVVGAVARNAFREAIRDRILFSLAFFAVLMIGAALLFAQMSFGVAAGALINFSLATITLLGVVIAIFLGNQLVAKEIERRTLHTLLAHPVRRAQFLLGKFAGLTATLAVNCGLMGLALFLALLAVLPGHVAPGESALAAAVFFILLALAVLTALALLFSTISSPVLAAIFTLGVFIVGNFDADLRALGESSRGRLGGHLAILASYLLPNFGAFNWVTAAAHFSAPSWRLLALNTLYAAVYSAVALVIAAAVFENKELK